MGISVKIKKRYLIRYTSDGDCETELKNRKVAYAYISYLDPNYLDEMNGYLFMDEIDII